MRTRSASRRRLCRRAWCRSSRPRSPSSSRTTTCSTRCACSPPRSGEARTASASTARATCWSRASSTWRSWTATRSCGHRPSAASCEGRRCVARWSSLRSTSCRAASWRGSCRRLGGFCCLWSRPLCTRVSAPASLHPRLCTRLVRLRLLSAYSQLACTACPFTARLHSSPAHSSLVHSSFVQFTAFVHSSPVHSWPFTCRARSPLPTSSRRGRSFFSPATRTATPSSGWTASRSAMGGRARSTRRSSGSSSKTPPPGARTTSRCRRAAREIDLN
mmetsp:Transcript_28906/g.92619  ORF Transcript_28906/g.92619 Transcript_28906/m.92619 type:complete len:275 (+) Transcript_28906:621-1445(+)